MSEYTSGDNISNERGSIDSNQPTSDSDGDGSTGDTRPVRGRSEHLGAVEIDVSDQVTGFHYDDEPDSVVVTSSDGDTVRVSPEEARSLVGDVSAALDAIATEREERA